MLSTHSFNALLKTLEEPPPHVKFLLATTDPQKLPVTVLSRCLQFNLKRLPVAQIAERMRHILETEGIAFEPAGLRLVAQAADGSVRDALSLLDQLIAFGGGNATEAEARAMLGTIARDHVVHLAEALASLNAPDLLRCAQSLEEFAPDHAQLLDELAALLVRVALKQAVSDFEGDELYAPELLERLAAKLAPEDVQLFYQTAIVGRRDLALAPDPRTGFEMTLVRMLAFRPSGIAQAQSRAADPPSPRTAPAQSLGAVADSRSAPTKAATPKAATLAAPVAPTAPPAAAAGSPNGNPSGAAATAGAAALEGTGVWPTILSQLDLQGAARQLAANCVLLGRQGAVVRLALDPRNKFMRTPSLEDKVAQALSKYFGELVRLEFEMALSGAETPAVAGQRSSQEELESARRALEADPGVQGLRERFGATLLPETVRPVKS